MEQVENILQISDSGWWHWLKKVRTDVENSCSMCPPSNFLSGKKCLFLHDNVLQHFITIRIRWHAGAPFCVEILSAANRAGTFMEQSCAARFSRQIFNFSGTFARATLYLRYHFSYTLNSLFCSDSSRSSIINTMPSVQSSSSCQPGADLSQSW